MYRAPRALRQTRAPLWGLLLALLPALVTAETFVGKCTAVADGDTISVMREGKAVRIRLYGIDAPETGQDFSAVAKAMASELCFGRQVRVEVRDTDRYGRLVAVVTTPEGIHVNETLVEAGLAWWYQEYARDEERLKRLEEGARQARRGLWSMPNAIAPWDYRRTKRAQPANPAASSPTPAPAAPQPGAASTAADPARPTATVYIVTRGKAYHRTRNCPSLARSKPTATTRAEAQAMDRTPCRQCYR